MTDHWGRWESEAVTRVDPRQRPHLRRLGRRLRAMPGGHRIRVRVTRMFFLPLSLPGEPAMRKFSHWRVDASCRCGLREWDAVPGYHSDSPGLSFRRLLRAVRAWTGGMGCRERAALAAVEDILSS